MITIGTDHEEKRLEALQQYALLDTQSERVFDDITATAAGMFHVPMSCISLIDRDRIWFKSHHGLDVQQSERTNGLCETAILSHDVYHVRDAREDVKMRTNPFVTGHGIRFYAGATLRGGEGLALGTLSIMDRNPRLLSEAESSILTKLAALTMDQIEMRLAAKKICALEDEQHRMNEKLRQMLSALHENEERYRDLFEEAPIAYVHEAVDTRFIRANRAAGNILGIKPEEIIGTFGRDLIPDKPDAQRHLNELLESIRNGMDPNGVVLELRRQDNGKPVWIQLWSKPDPSGKFTRTMFIDITARILMEQEQAQLHAQNAYLSEEIRQELDFGEIIGDSPAVRKVKQQIQLVAATDAAVLIAGESGTGKELVARAIHQQSLRKERPLIKVNCGAIPENLFESEFFGHARGSFTGAHKDKPGRFELADGGTLFLDEIGELPLAMQSKLLRVLQEHEVERVGETRTRKVDVRIIAASNRDLKTEVEAKRFRQDLFYRLSVFPVEVPPLRQRREDIPKLALHFVRLTARKMNRPPPRLTKAHAEQLALHDWPGNIREFQNVLERAVILAQGGALRFEIPTFTVGGSPLRDLTPREATTILTRKELKRRESESIAKALKQTGGKLFGSDGAAELLGMKPTTLASRIKALGLTRRPTGKAGDVFD